jgi:hypothetical protein
MGGGDLRINPFSDIYNWLTGQSKDQNILDILNNPGLRESAKVAELEKIFSGLSESEKASLYERLKTKDRIDPLSRQFHYRLSHSHKPGHLSSVDKLLKALNPSHQSDIGTNVNGNQTTRKSSQINEKKAEGTARQAELENRIKASEFEKGVMSVIQVAHDAKSAKDAIRPLLENATPDQLRQVISASEKWRPENKKIIDQAIAESSDLMKKVATQLTPYEQSKALNRVLAADYSGDSDEKNATGNARSQALRSWISNTPKAVLNEVLKKSMNSEMINKEVINQMSYGDFSGFDKLDPRYKGGLLKILNHNPQVSSETLMGIFNRMTPTEKNAVIDLYQKDNPDTLPDFLKKISPHLNKYFMEGINEENAKFIRDTYLTLAEEDATEAERATYKKLANYIFGWIEETFKNQ